MALRSFVIISKLDNKSTWGPLNPYSHFKTLKTLFTIQPNTALQTRRPRHPFFKFIIFLFYFLFLFVYFFKKTNFEVSEQKRLLEKAPTRRVLARHVISYFYPPMPRRTWLHSWWLPAASTHLFHTRTSASRWISFPG